MKIEYTCPRCHYQFSSERDAATEGVECPCCMNIIRTQPSNPYASPETQQPDVPTTTPDVTILEEPVIPPYPNAPTYEEPEEPSSVKFIKRLAIFVTVLALAGAAYLFYDGSRVGKGNDKKVLGTTLAAYFEKNGYDKLSEYFLIDIDGDGTEEGVANNNTRLVVCQQNGSEPKVVCDEAVAEWMWIEDQGIFAVFSDSKKKGDASWMLLKDGEMVKDETRPHYHYKGKKYYSNTDGKDISISREQYYDIINSIIQKYTKVEPIKVDGEESK
ncbi:MAG: hypothetical protein K5893_12045 [Prevotella sp.]|nr:hypothetical protein [Prevotella sp.]